jgi:uncharacterized membrane protein
MTQPIEEKTIRLLRRHYFINFIVLGILFLLTLFPVARSAETPTSPPVIIDQCSILLTIIGIPVALKSFSNKINKKPRPNDAKKGIKIYKKAFLQRLYLLSFVILWNILASVISHNRNYIWLIIILFITLLFCKPSFPELKNLIEIKNKENEITE